MRLVLDAMGSDNAPTVEVEGALQASAELDAEIILVGQQKVIEKELAKHTSLMRTRLSRCMKARPRPAGKNRILRSWSAPG